MCSIHSRCPEHRPATTLWVRVPATGKSVGSCLGSSPVGSKICGNLFGFESRRLENLWELVWVRVPSDGRTDRQTDRRTMCTLASIDSRLKVPLMRLPCVTIFLASYNRIHQVAPISTCSYCMVPWGHAGLPPKLHLSRFSRFCTTHGHERHTQRHS